MAISAPGVGSGLDIQGIVSQLVALEQRPLQQLQQRASSLQTQLSAFGQLKSQLANLQDQMARLVNPTTWSTLSVTSSNSAAVSGSLKPGATASRFSVEVSQLARSQAAASAPVAAGTQPGSGTLSISLGTWGLADADNDPLTADTPVFTQSALAAVDVTVAEGDTLSAIATKINAAGAGVTATVITDASGERLAVRSVETGEEQAFRIQVSNLGAGSTLDQLTYDPQTTSSGMVQTQAAQNTLAKINGVDVTSTNNLFDGVVAGVSLRVSQVTTSAADITVAEDKAGIRTRITNFVESYNALSNALKEMTKYDAATKTAGSLQGDSTAVGLQSALRRLVSGLGPPGTDFKRLSDIGLEFQQDGTLSTNAGKLAQALDKIEDLKTFFAAPGAEGSDGLAVRIRNFTQGMLNGNGAINTRNQNLQSSIDRNNNEQEKITERVERVEARLLAQYSRLDAQLAGLNALSSYVAQQVTTWNNQKSN